MTRGLPQGCTESCAWCSYFSAPEDLHLLCFFIPSLVHLFAFNSVQHDLVHHGGSVSVWMNLLSAVLPMRLLIIAAVLINIATLLFSVCLFRKPMRAWTMCPSLFSSLFSPPLPSTHLGTATLPWLSVPFPEVLDPVSHPAGIHFSPVWILSFLVTSPVYVNGVMWVFPVCLCSQVSMVISVSAQAPFYFGCTWKLLGILFITFFIINPL